LEGTTKTFFYDLVSRLWVPLMIASGHRKSFVKKTTLTQQLKGEDGTEEFQIMYMQIKENANAL
jgi:hypothetical protein